MGENVHVKTSTKSKNNNAKYIFFGSLPLAELLQTPKIASNFMQQALVIVLGISLK